VRRRRRRRRQWRARGWGGGGRECGISGHGEGGGFEESHEEWNESGWWRRGTGRRRRVQKGVGGQMYVGRVLLRESGRSG